MKIRIKGASVRFRLSRTEVAALVHEGRVGDETPFAGSVFRYEIVKTADGDALSADFIDGQIRLLVPQGLIIGWDINDLISIDGRMALDEGRILYLLLEKDFQCLDGSTEDQSDNYINPNKTC